MPVYEYQCKKCGREFEYQQRMSDPDKTQCEACGAEALERLISRTAFSLKGGGWYKDLYASTKPEKSDAPSSGDSKPAAAPDSSSTPSATPAASTPSAGGGSTASGGASSGGGSASGGGSSSGGSSSGGSSSGGSSSGGDSSGGASSGGGSTTKTASST
ncbi:MAG: zinc ribbon domain-containing protein [Deltaproteobacteria bacterium]